MIEPGELASIINVKISAKSIATKHTKSLRDLRQSTKNPSQYTYPTCGFIAAIVRVIGRGDITFKDVVAAKTIVQAHKIANWP
jgi:hypothetical protein